MSPQPSPRDELCATLRRLLDAHGEALLDDPQRLRSMLADLMHGSCAVEIRALLWALQGDLRKNLAYRRRHGLSSLPFLAADARPLVEEGLQEPLALWAVAAWAELLAGEVAPPPLPVPPQTPAPPAVSVAGPAPAQRAAAAAAAHVRIGEPCGGGVLAYILKRGDRGYVPGEVHGLIAATADQTPAGSGIQWATRPHRDISLPGALGTKIGIGAANSDAIIARNGAGASYAAGLARAYTGGGHSDWYLPSKDELDKLYLSREAIGGFHTERGNGSSYWSSSEYEPYVKDAWYQAFDDGFQYNNVKSTTNRVRAVRAF
jgi:hypothetical protein